jgi:hypothetical protein
MAEDLLDCIKAVAIVHQEASELMAQVMDAYTIQPGLSS